MRSNQIGISLHWKSTIWLEDFLLFRAKDANMCTMFKAQRYADKQKIWEFRMAAFDVSCNIKKPLHFVTAILSFTPYLVIFWSR